MISTPQNVNQFIFMKLGHQWRSIGYSVFMYLISFNLHKDAR